MIYSNDLKIKKKSSHRDNNYSYLVVAVAKCMYRLCDRYWYLVDIQYIHNYLET